LIGLIQERGQGRRNEGRWVSTDYSSERDGENALTESELLGRLRLDIPEERVHGCQSVVPGTRGDAALLLEVIEEIDDKWSINLP
jgi:hypothetical protein